jgi:hypothetical protein
MSSRLIYRVHVTHDKGVMQASFHTLEEAKKFATYYRSKKKGKFKSISLERIAVGKLKKVR